MVPQLDKATTTKNENENDKDMVQLTSQRATRSFSNFLIWTVENTSKRQCGRKSIAALSSMTTKTHTFEMHQCGQGLRLEKQQLWKNITVFCTLQQ